MKGRCMEGDVPFPIRVNKIGHVGLYCRDLERMIEKQEYKARLKGLQSRMYDLQQALFEARRPALVVFEGWAGTSKIGTSPTAKVARPVISKVAISAALRPMRSP